MFFLLFALWILFNGQWTGEIAVTGVVLCGLIYLFIWKFMDYSPRKEWRLCKLLPKAIAYLGYLIKEICVSAVQTLRFVWSAKEEVEPQLVSFHAKVKTEAGRVILANSITMTPGTITVDVRDDLFLVHCLDSSFADGIDDSEMQKRVCHLEKEGKDRG